MDFQDNSDKLLHDNSASDKAAQAKLKQGGGNPGVPDTVGSVDHTLLTVNSQIKLEIPWYERLLNFCATPFSYETGFYFKGKKTYHMQVCGFCTIIGALFLMASTFVLFEPLLSGRVVMTDLETASFNTLHRGEQREGVPDYYAPVPNAI